MQVAQEMQETLDMMIKLQTEDANGPNSGGFREVFDNIVTGVGASVYQVIYH